MKRQCYTNTQYSRNKCLEVVEIFRQIEDNQLETKVLSIFKNFDCTNDSCFIDDFHCLGENNKRVTITFRRKKYCTQVIQVKKDLKGLNTGDLDLPRGT